MTSFPVLDDSAQGTLMQVHNTYIGVTFSLPVSYVFHGDNLKLHIINSDSQDLQQWHKIYHFLVL